MENIKSFKELTEAKMAEGPVALEKAVKSIKTIIAGLDKYDYQKNKELAKVYDMSNEASEFCHDAQGAVKKWADKALKEKDFSEVSEEELKFISKNADMIEVSMTIMTDDFRKLSDALSKAIS